MSRLIDLMMQGLPYSVAKAQRDAEAALPSVQSEPMFCRCGAALIETSNGHFVCSFIAAVEKRQNAASEARRGDGHGQ
jgi:hypothetical protein